MTEPQYTQVDSNWYETAFLNEVAEELRKKAMMVSLSLTTFSKADQLAYNILKNHIDFEND